MASVPVSMIARTPIRSSRMPATGAVTAAATDPTTIATDNAPRPHCMFSVIGLRKMGNVFMTMPHRRNKITKQAATM